MLQENKNKDKDRDSLMCHSSTAPTDLHPMGQTENQPNDRYLRQLGHESGSMHSPRSQVQYSTDCAKQAPTCIQQPIVSGDRF